MLKVQPSICPEKLAGDLVLANNNGSDYAPAIITFNPTTGTHFKIMEEEIYYYVRYLDELESSWVRGASIKDNDCNQRITKRKSSIKKQQPDDVSGKIWELGKLNRRSRLGQIEKWNCIIKTEAASATASQENSTCDSLSETNGFMSSPHKRKRPSYQCNGIKKSREPTREEMAEELFFTPPSSLEDNKEPSVTTDNLHTRTFQDGKCSICGLNSNSLVACEGDCCKLFHLQCLAIPDYCGNFICDECAVMALQCFACKKSGGTLNQCSVTNCNKLYHVDCLQQYSRLYDTDRKGLVCPRHKCAKCLMACSASTKKLVCCTKCPIALHDRESCLIAGCEVFTSNPKYMVCYKHIERPGNKQLSSINLTSCLHCGEGGLLLCCDFCSASYHAECLPEKYNTISSNWLCPDCVEHQNPTYGSVVWCKLGKYRWWPSLIVLPKVIPQCLLKHKMYQGTFLVEFLGSGDHSWIHHGRCLPFTDESIARLTFYTKRIDQQFKSGYTIAMELYEEAKAKLEKQLHKKPSKKFTHLKSNKYLVPPNSLKEIWPCQCTEEHPCDLDSVCVNRATMTECRTDTCPVKHLCQNQRIQKQQYADTVAYYTKNTGWGLKATHDIKNGDFVIEYVGEVISKEMCSDRIKKAQEKGEKNFYMLTLEAGLVIDACYKANKARFINHSCDPNLETQAWTVNGKTCISLFAIKDIPTGTELTFDYHLDCVGDVKSKCYCGTPTCVGFLGGKRNKIAEKPAISTTSKKTAKKPRKERKATGRGKKTVQRKKVEQNTTSPSQSSTHEDLCFWCGDGGELVMCDKKGCPKAYHVECLEIDGIPKGKWICPWHFCDECGVRSSKCCPCCPTSFCTQHGEGELQECNGISYCVDHIP